MAPRLYPGERTRSAGRLLAEPLESLAQNVARRAVELVVEALDINALLARTDVNMLLDQVDVNRVLDRVDVDRLIAHADVQALLEQVDVNRVLDRVDVDRLIARVDVQALLDKVDVNGLAGRVDVDALLEQTEFRNIISRSSSTIASEGVDLVRSQAVGLDEFIARWVNRLRHRPYSGPSAPPAVRGSPELPQLPGSPSLQGER